MPIEKSIHQNLIIGEAPAAGSPGKAMASA